MVRRMWPSLAGRRFGVQVFGREPEVMAAAAADLAEWGTLAPARISVGVAPHAPYTVSDAAFERIVMYARQLDLPIQTHLAETAGEVAARLVPISN